MSVREARLWLEWYAQQQNKPDRSDHYLMLIAQEVRYVLHNKPRPPLDTMKIKFGNDKKPKLTREQAAAQSKARWFGLAGFKPPWRK